jgi:Uma2 family endonuclease
MATITSNTNTDIRYPTSDGRPMAETDLHRDIMVDTIQKLDSFFAPKPMVYVSGNLLIYYVHGNKRKHVSPDVFVAFGVPKKKRDYYLTWEEGKNPSVVIEITSSSTRREDVKKKFELYRDVLEVKEYFLFDPRSDYLKPRLTGYRLSKGDYVPISVVQGRMPSRVLGLQLEAEDANLRLYDPQTGGWLATSGERVAQAEQQVARMQAETLQLAEDNQRLRQELERLLGQRNP